MSAFVSFRDRTRKKMSSDDDSNYNGSDEELDFVSDLPEAKPFLFEPTYAENEIEERLRNLDAARNNVLETQTEEHSCRCGKCVPIPDTPQIVCCRDYEQVNNRREEKPCITESPGFPHVCRNVYALQAALGTWHQMTDEVLDVCNKSYRFIAYKQFIAWVFGKLGSGVRRQIPSCVVDDIRRNFPAPDNVYVPFCDTDS